MIFQKSLEGYLHDSTALYIQHPDEEKRVGLNDAQHLSPGATRGRNASGVAHRPASSARDMVMYWKFLCTKSMHPAHVKHDHIC